MPCYRPLDAYYSKIVNPKTGKRGIVFKATEALIDRKLQVPCGQCIGCRLEKSRQWAVRCVHEASMYENNCFITLTYNDENLPKNKSLDVTHYQKFMKRLRKRYGENIRFFHCGEYGENYGRPHYHACLFNFDFPDKTLWKTVNDNNLYISDALSSLWPYGHCSIGDVTFESAAYVARYIMKKVTGDAAADHYLTVDMDTGEIYDRRPEYITMSRRPGIGKLWFDKYKKETYTHDSVIVRGHETKPPRFYDNQYEREYPSDLSRIKSNRIINGKKYIDNNSVDRLIVRERVKNAQIKSLKRTLD